MRIASSCAVALAPLLLLAPPAASLPSPQGGDRLQARAHLFGSSFGVPGNASYDYVVVGGGTAGLTAAVRLAEAGSSVAVVEAGSFYELGNGNLSEIPAYDARWTSKSPKDVNPLVDWGFVTTPQQGLLNASVHYARGKALGGCTSRNYMAYHRGTEGSYKMWADRVGDASYEFDSWLPYFQKSFVYTPPDMSKRAANATPAVDTASLASGKGPVSLTVANYANAASSWVQRGFSSIGISPINGFTSGKLLGSSYLIDTINATTQTRDSSETSFLRSAMDNSLLTVYQSTLAKRILFDGTAATGVQVESAGMAYSLSATKEVIVSAGAFQSPQLLMVSGVGPAHTLKKHKIPVVADRPGVGQNMWDHVFMGISYRMNVITASSLSDPAFLAQASGDFDNDQSGILTNPGGDWLAFEKAPRSLMPNSSVPSLSAWPSDWPEIEYLSMSGYLGNQEDYAKEAPTDGYNYHTVSTALVAPLSRGTVDISSADTSDPPVISPNWLTHPTDQAIMIAGFKRVRQMFQSAAMRPAVIGSEAYPGDHVQGDAAILDTIRRSLSTVFHASATCAMGRANDSMAVVDSKARVFGVQNLRIVDASAFPLLPPGHPTGTVYALAEKIADDIITSS